MRKKNHTLTITKTLPCIRYKGSVTVEASLIVPVFVLFLVLFLGLFRVQQIEMQVNQALSYAALEVAADGRATLLDSMGVKGIFFEMLDVQGCKISYIKDGRKGIKLSEEGSDASFVRLKVSYQVCLPVNLFGKDVVEVVQSAVARRWIGYQTTDDQNNQWVYVTPFGSAYHTTAGCSYLDLSIWSISKTQIDAKRNADGGKYYPCSLCVRSNVPDGYETVYVTDYGVLYHRSLDCSSLKRTIYRIQMEQVGGRTPCPKCNTS
ncbi:MAG: hypothetical protein IJ471_01855 [Eubacterium sp.]|nr:hypothetical protein [Eubacterium sp.]